ncbi:MAG: DcaP family trimeric outer membrane transporter [Planctomycetota bacterium]
MSEKMSRNIILLIVATALSLACTAGADETADLADENADLRQRVEKLDKELGELKKALMQKDEPTEAKPLLPVLSSLDIQLYGFLKLDAAYDTSQTDDGNFAKWVERENTNRDDDQFNMTANQSRFGIMISGPDGGAMKTSGRAEVDFYGGGSPNKAHLMMRHAYMKLDWPEERFNIIAGQTSDVIGPLVPATVNYTVAWWTGNIGYRRPQIRLTKVLGIDGDVDLTLEGAVARTIGRDNLFLAGTLDSGEDSGQPTLQARASVTAPVFCIKPATIGLSGHYGEEEYDVAANGSDKEFRSWSLNADFVQPVNDWLAIKSELFTGENLDAYFGGIGQGVTLTGANMYDEIGSSGGWVAASLGPWSGRRYNFGVAVDDVDRDDVNEGARTLNRSVFANMFHAFDKNAEFALELAHWKTDYAGNGDADSFRIQTAFIYKF